MGYVGISDVSCFPRSGILISSRSHEFLSDLPLVNSTYGSARIRSSMCPYCAPCTSIRLPSLRLSRLAIHWIYVASRPLDSYKASSMRNVGGQDKGFRSHIVYRLLQDIATGIAIAFDIIAEPATRIDDVLDRWPFLDSDNGQPGFLSMARRRPAQIPININERALHGNDKVCGQFQI